MNSESETTSSYFSSNNKNSDLKKNEKIVAKKSKIDKIEGFSNKEKMTPSKKIKLLNSNETDFIKNNNANPELFLISKSDKWEPLNWKIILDNIRKMRSDIPAPVDTMGCDKCYDENVTDKEKRFNILLALMLSPRTKDEVTYAVMKKLKQKIIPLSPENVLKIDKSDMEELLKPAAFYKTKAGHIKRTSHILIQKYESDIPNSLEGLMNLPGVSSKIGHICMRAAWNVVTGIGVDVHVHRISNRLKWVKKETKTPEETRIQLESWAPKEFWGDINHLLVGFGQTFCKALKPKCDSCLNTNICPHNKNSSTISKKSVKKKNLDW